MPFAPINGIEMYYRIYGEGPPVIWAHGGGGSHVSWFQQVPHFSQKYRNIVFDHRGFGRSTDPNGEGEARFHEDLEALMDHLGIERAALVAQSMGGRTTLGFSVRHPERVSALVMCDTWGRFDWPEMLDRSRVLEREATERWPLDETVEAMFNEELQPGSEEAEAQSILRRAYARSFNRRDPAMALLLNQNFLAHHRPDGTGSSSPGRVSSGYGPDEVAALRIPALFLVGAEDERAIPEIVRKVAALIPESEVAEVAGSGHSTYWEDPETFNRVVDAFLSKHLR